MVLYYFVKIIGKKKDLTPEEGHLLQEKLISEMEKNRPYQKPKGIILKFKTWQELDEFNLQRAAKKI